MNRLVLASLFTLPLFSLTDVASADNIAKCEVVLMQTIEDESGRGGAQVASYRPAGDFLASVYQDEIETVYTIDDLPIRAVMCERSDVVPNKSDFKILATGIPFFLSQSFESQDTDLISMFFKDGAFRYSYKGPGLSEEAEALLKNRLTLFNEMEHDLGEKEAALKAKAPKDETADDDDQKQSTDEAKDTLDAPSESE